MLSGSEGLLLGQLQRLLPYLLEKGLRISSLMGRVQLCWILVPILSWVCRIKGICSVAWQAGHTILIVRVVPRCPCCAVCRPLGLWCLGVAWVFSCMGGNT